MPGSRLTRNTYCILYWAWCYEKLILGWCAFLSLTSLYVSLCVHSYACKCTCTVVLSVFMFWQMHSLVCKNVWLCTCDSEMSFLLYNHMRVTEASISRDLLIWSRSQCLIPSCTIDNSYCTSLLPFAACSLFPSVSAYIDSTIGKTVGKKYYLQVNWYVYKNRNSWKQQIQCTQFKCFTVLYVKHIVICYTL